MSDVAAAPTTEPAKTEPTQPEKIETPVDSSKQEPSLLYEAKPETQPEEPEQDDGEGTTEPSAAPETDGDAISTVDELIEQNQFDPEWFNNLKVNVKVDRQTSAVPLSDLVKTYQINAAADKRLEEAKTQAKAITQAAAEKHQAIEQDFAAIGALVQQAEAMLESDVKSADLKSLRLSDPAEYAARKADLEERAKQIQALKNGAANAFRERTAKQQSEYQARLQSKLTQEADLLLERIPAWRDEETAKREKSDVRNYLVHDYKFGPDEVGTVFDHRHIDIARKAMLYDRLQNKTDPAKKRVVKVPKVLKPGSQSQPSRPKNTSIVDDLYGNK